MNCFYHQDRTAIGFCRSCQRSLCPECAAEFPRGLACKAHCEEDVQNLIRLIDNNIRMAPSSARLMAAQRGGGLLAAGFYLITGAVFLIGGIRDNITMIMALGGALFVFGLVSLIRVLRLTSRMPKPEN